MPFAKKISIKICKTQYFLIIFQVCPFHPPKYHWTTTRKPKSSLVNILCFGRFTGLTAHQSIWLVHRPGIADTSVMQAFVLFLNVNYTQRVTLGLLTLVPFLFFSLFWKLLGMPDPLSGWQTQSPPGSSAGPAPNVALHHCAPVPNSKSVSGRLTFGIK